MSFKRSHQTGKTVFKKSPVRCAPSDPRVSFPARSCDTIRANRSPSSISVCCMRWRLQLAGLEVSEWWRGDGDWLHCELESTKEADPTLDYVLTKNSWCHVKEAVSESSAQRGVLSPFRDTSLNGTDLKRYHVTQSPGFQRTSCRRLLSESHSPTPRLWGAMKLRQARAPKTQRRLTESPVESG